MDAIDHLWTVATRRGPIDARRLLDALSAVRPEAVERADERTKMLVRDAAIALRKFPAVDPGHARRANALPAFPLPEPDPMNRGFPSLALRLMEPTDPAVVYEFLQDLSRRVRVECSITIGGSISLMLDGLIARATEDIDVVDEVPEPIRREHDLLRDLTRQYGLQLTHFQSHYLNDGWPQRVRSLGRFGSIAAFRIDPVDVLVGKLFSARRKDLADIQAALPSIDRAAFIDRLATTTDRWRAIPAMAEAARSNWYVITGEAALPDAR